MRQRSAIRKKRRWLFSDQRGEGILEYAIILALVGLVAVLALSTFGETIRDVYQSFQPPVKTIQPPTVDNNTAVP